MKDRAVMTRANLSIKLLPEKEEDKKLAALLTYQTADCEYAHQITMKESMMLESAT